MTTRRSVLITGAAGNLGKKLRRRLEGRHELRLLDREPRGDDTIVRADLSRWDPAWVRLFAGVDTVFHFAADSAADVSWPDLIPPNIDGLIHAYEAAAQGGVRRFVYASSNHVMGGYQEVPDVLITPELPPRPGTRYVLGNVPKDSTPYGSAKLFGERLGKVYAEVRGLSVIAVRFGWIWHGDNTPAGLPPDRDDWFRMKWLSDRDFCTLMECCLDADPDLRFAVVHGMSANTGMRWDIGATKRLLGYEPRDDVTRNPQPEIRSPKKIAM
jgi:nucleoside-diphosphate-sugar epimerase